jgi:DNA-binding Xre family transcriptional regulator
MANVSLEQLKTAAKSVMKKQNKSYQELANHLGLSLVSVKRIMSKEEVSMSRFLEICDWLDTGLAELEKIATYNQANKKQHFTLEQEAFLAKSTQYLSFLFNLYVEETPEKIQKKYNLTNKTINLYLLRLEKYGLIKKVGGRYKPYYKDFPSPIPYGELDKSLYKNVLETGMYFFKRNNEIMNQRKNREADRGSSTTITVVSLSRDSYLAWFEKYKNLCQELANTGQVEDKIEGLKNKKTAVLMHLHALVDENDIEIESIQNMFGKPVEL